MNLYHQHLNQEIFFLREPIKLEQWQCLNVTHSSTHGVHQTGFLQIISLKDSFLDEQRVLT